MWPAYGLIALTLAGCAHGSVTTQPLSLEVNPAPSTVQEGMFDIRLMKTSGEDQCVFRDGVETPTSSYLITELRVGNRRLAEQDGYILPPRVAGMKCFAPGTEILFRADMRGRQEIAKLAGEGRLLIRFGLLSYSCKSPPTVGGGRINLSGWTELPDQLRP